MYNGLFGDLPAAASSGGGDGEQPDRKSQTATQPQPEKKAKAAPEPHLLFVPQQAKRRKGKPQATQKRRPPTSALQSNNGLDKQPALPAASSSTAAFESDIIVCRKPTDDTVKEEPGKETYSPSLSDSKEHSTLHDTTTIPQPATAPSSSSTPTCLVDDERYHTAVEEAKEDPYDPMVPNDLLQYRRTQAIAREKHRLLEERDAAIRDQEMMRRRIEEERLQLEKEGNMEKIVEHRVQQGMGRGRGGVSNLPAWVVAQQQQEQKRGGARTG